MTENIEKLLEEKENITNKLSEINQKIYEILVRNP